MHATFHNRLPFAAPMAAWKNVKYRFGIYRTKGPNLIRSRRYYSENSVEFDVTIPLKIRIKKSRN